MTVYDSMRAVNVSIPSKVSISIDVTVKLDVALIAFSSANRNFMMVTCRTRLFWLKSQITKYFIWTWLSLGHGGSDCAN